MIGKSRHLAALATGEGASREQFGQGCGVLQHSPPPGSYRHTRHLPGPELAAWVQHFWIETWNWHGAAPQRREVLPLPSVHLAFIPGRSRIFGVQLGRFARELTGNGCVVGVKLRPGAFYPFLRRPVSGIANTSLPLGDVFVGSLEAEREIFAHHEEAAMVKTAAGFLTARLPPEDPNVELACGIVEAIAADKSITRVDQVVSRWRINERSLQRLFRRHVGASARWVIKRYRIYEALQRLSSEMKPEWADLAQEIGYFDQAHFINDFRKLVGCSPAQYSLSPPSECGQQQPG
ncbi:MAG: DUF6597 domain-containing transcriptional factor [Pseudomonadota bacterium]